MLPNPFHKSSSTPSTSLVSNLMVTHIPLVYSSWTVKKVLDLLESHAEIFDVVDFIYVLNDKEELVGVFSIKNLFNKSPKTRVSSFMEKKLVTFSVNTTIEQASQIIIKSGLKEIPLVSSKKILGVVSSRHIFSSISSSLKRQALRTGGIHQAHDDYQSALDIPLLSAVRHRLPWLLLGMSLAMLMAIFITNFEETLSKFIIIASFIPVIVYISGALTAQTVIVFVRDLALISKGYSFRKYFFKQLGITFFISSLLSIILFSFIYLIWSNARIALVIALATGISLILTAIVSILLTILIKRFKFDPALGSGPLSTVISDILSIVIYFLVVMLLL